MYFYVGIKNVDYFSTYTKVILQIVYLTPTFNYTTLLICQDYVRSFEYWKMFDAGTERHVTSVYLIPVFCVVYCVRDTHISVRPRGASDRAGRQPFCYVILDSTSFLTRVQCGVLGIYAPGELCLSRCLNCQVEFVSSSFLRDKSTRA